VAGEVSRSLRAQIAARAGRRCEYCRIHEDDTGNAHHVDHIVSRKHGGPAVLLNLAYACVVCNRNKGTDVASIGPAPGQVIRLYNPRKDDWTRHFILDGPVIRPLSEIARATARTLKLNAVERVEERRVLQAVGRYPAN
jgi:hypothetical protein